MWETPLSENLQKEIVTAYERLCRPIPTNPIELLGYKISFMGEAHLRWLFGDIFMDASYLSSVGCRLDAAGIRPFTAKLHPDVTKAREGNSGSDPESSWFGFSGV